MSRPELEIAFHVLEPKREDEEPVAEGRRLGLGLAAVRLSSAPTAGGAPQPVLASRSA